MGESLRKKLKKYATVKTGRSITEVLITLLVLAISITLSAYAFYTNHYWLSGIACVLQGLTLLRVFILQHDCGHCALFKTKRQNQIVGTLLAFFVFTPFYSWAMRHMIHHSTSGNLDKRGVGDIDLLTTAEYNQASTSNKLFYRITRNPFIFVLFGGLFVFLIQMRFDQKAAHSKSLLKTKKMKLSIYLTNVVLILGYGTLIYFLGFTAFLMFALIPFWIAAIVGVILFYVQHNFENSYFKHDNEWNRNDASLKGCSYFKLPWILAWFTANIGYHHIHHYNARIPFYNLPKCYAEVPEMKNVVTITLKTFINLFGFKLFCCKLNKLLTFKTAKKEQIQKG